MKIEENKKYNLRNGEIVDDLKRKGYAWHSEKLNKTWYEYGKHYWDTDSMLDIVSEYVEGANQYRINLGDEVNSFLIAILQSLTTQQMIDLRDGIEMRIPKQPLLWWESLKKGDKFKYANNVETVDDIITYKFNDSVIICSGEYRFSVNHCTPYIEIKRFSDECAEWLSEKPFLLDSDILIKIKSMIEKLREYEKGKYLWLESPSDHDS